jgi:phenylacetate-CoA ligase
MSRRSLYGAWVSGVLFPLQERVKGHDTVARLTALERSQWLDPEALAALSLARLRGFLRDIGAQVPYYRELFRREGFDPAGVQSVGDLARLPFLTKPAIRAAGDALRSGSRAAATLRRYNTGGSSGEPLVFYIGSDRRSHDVAAKWRATRWWDVDIGDREIVVWGSPIELGAQDRIRQWRDRLMRTRLLPAFEMSPGNLDRFVEAIVRFRPRMVFGYPSALAHIARHALERGMPLHQAGVRVAFVTSERLYDDQREVIARVFGCRVANGYGSRDAGFIAHECPEGGMHVSAEDIVVEIVDPSGRVLPCGEAGEIVVTHLATASFPFVRYRTGDVAVLDAARCRCGRGLPLLSRIEGRTSDFVVARDGTVMHGLALIYAVRDLPGVEQFRIVQHDLDRTDVELVASPAFGPEQQARLVRDFKARLGAAVEVGVRRVAAIVPERSGKHRYVVSHVGLSGGGGSAPSREAPAGAESPHG